MTCDDAKGSEEKHLSHLFNKMKLPKWIFFFFFFFSFTLSLCLSGPLGCNCVSDCTESRFRGLIKSEGEDALT